MNDLKFLIVTVFSILEIEFSYSNKPRFVKESGSNRGYDCLKKLTESNLRTIIYVYNNTDVKDLSLDVYGVYKPVYNINTFKLEDAEAYNWEIAGDEEKLYIVSLYDINLCKQTIHTIGQLEFWKSRDRLIFIVERDANNAETISECFRSCLNLWMINVAVIFVSNFDKVYTYNPFTNNFLTEQSCSEIFPDKTLDLHGFRLNISIFDDNINARKVNKSYHGRDGLMVHTIMHIMKANYVYVTPNGSLPYGAAIKDVCSAVTQVTFNSIFTQLETKKQYEQTYPHDKSDVVVLVPLTNVVYRNLYGAISPALWIGTVCMGVFLFVYLYKVNKQLDVVAIMMLILAIISGRPIKVLKSKYFRTVFMSAMVLSFYIIVDFNCKLTSVLTIPTVPPGVKTLQELSKVTDRKILTREAYSDMLKKALDHRIRDKILSKLELMSEVLDQHEIMRCIDHYIICRGDLADLGLKESLMKDRRVCYRIMDESIVPSWLSYIVTYGSPFLSRFNSIICRITESGLQDYWKERITFSYHSSDHDKEPYKISLGLLFPAFALWGAGLCISLLAFVFECTYFQYKHTYRISNNKNQ